MAIREYFTIDIGGTYIKYAIVDEAFELKQQDKVPTPKSKEMLLETLYGLIGQHPELSGVCDLLSRKGDIRWDGLLWRRVTVYA